MTDQYAVIGNPIAHSRSPEIHTAFAQQTAQDIAYSTLLVDTAKGEFDKQVAAFFARGGCGLNITLPFKFEAYRLCRQLTERAQLAGSVNTLYRDAEGLMHGDTTDGIGLVRDLLANHRAVIRAKRLLLLGAGGAVHGVLGELLNEKPSQVVIANRTVAKAEQLVGKFSSLGPVYACGYPDLGASSSGHSDNSQANLQDYNSQFDLIINGTAASLGGDLPPLPTSILAPGAWCYDMMYAADTTPFNQWALQQGVECAVDGLGMLVEQAAESFFIWRGVKPETAPVIELIRSALTASNQR